jgi:hypothetical protein
MDRIAAGVVQRASLKQETFGMPTSVRDRTIHKEVPQSREYEHRHELDAISITAGDKGGRNNGEGELIHAINGLRNGRGKLVVRVHVQT